MPTFFFFFFPPPQTEEGKYPLKLHYFDNWLQRNMIGMAVCENPAMSPLVTCGTTSITVKLPRETKLKKVKELGKKWVFCCNIEVILETRGACVEINSLVKVVLLS